MLDIKFVRENPDLIKTSLKNKNETKVDVNEVLKVDKIRRGIQAEVDELRTKKNQASQQISQLKKEKKDVSEIILEMQKFGDDQKALELKLKEAELNLQSLLAWLPNVPDDDVPVGEDEKANKLIRTIGEKRNFDFDAIPHWELGENLNIMDFEAGIKIAGSSFYTLKGAGALLERALINFMLDLHTKTHLYTEVNVPFVANRDSMFGTGQIPKLESDMYYIQNDDMFLIPTAEVPLTNLLAGRTLKKDELPKYFTAYSACFRREAGAHGKDTRGLIRVHQFSKVELVKFTHPNESSNELELLLNDAEEVLKLLNLPYRVVLLSTGDMSFASAKTYDIEVWAPGCDKWLEVSSCSNFRDFQARRANIRFRDDDKKLKYAHTLNGSGVALPRLLISVIENYQQKDGSIDIPVALLPYFNGITKIEKIT